MIKSVSKDKIPKNFSYVLKTTQLEQALAEAKIDCHVDLIYRGPQNGGSVLEAEYWLPNERMMYPRVYIRAGVVPRELRAAASEALSKSALPKFIEWLQEILLLPDGAPALFAKPYFNAHYSEKGLTISHQQEYKVRK